MSKPDFETRFERALFASRWLMAPMYLGLVVALFMLAVIFAKELIYYFPQLFVMGPGELTPEDVILVVLTLIDLSLAGNLLLIVLFSGYENFVSKLDIAETVDRPSWMGTVDFSGLKMKLIASIVAISGIHLLKRFMEIGAPVEGGPRGQVVPINETELTWLVIIHLTFVVSGVLLALMDWLAAKTDKH